MEDFGDLAALWSSAPTQEDEAVLDRLARRTPQRARREMAIELVGVGGIALAIVLAVIFKLGAATVAVGAIILALLGWSAWHRHHLGARALMIDRGDQAEFLASSLAAKEAELKRSALGLALIVPGTFLAMLLLFVLRHAELGESLSEYLISAVSTPRGLATTALLAATVAVSALAHRRVRRELAALEALQAEYDEEARRDLTAGA